MKFGRLGSWACIVTGTVVALAAAALILYSITSFWGYLGMKEHLIHGILFVVALGGLVLIFVGRKSLHGRNVIA